MGTDEVGGTVDRVRVAMPMPRALLAAVVLLFAASGVILLAMAAAGAMPWWPVIVAWVALVWNVYVWGWRLAYEVVATDDTLHWRTLIWEGRMPIADLVSIRSGGLGVAVRDRGGARIHLPPFGLEPLIRHVQQRNPAVAVAVHRGGAT
jgi:hypothetical protein